MSTSCMHRPRHISRRRTARLCPLAVLPHSSPLRLLSITRSPIRRVGISGPTRLALMRIVLRRLHSPPFEPSSSKYSVSMQYSTTLVLFSQRLTLCANLSGSGKELKSSSCSAILCERSIISGKRFHSARVDNQRDTLGN